MRLQSFILEEPRIVGGNLQWVRQADIWARVRALRGQVNVRVGVNELVATHEVRLRYSAAVKVGGRLRRDARILDIHRVNEIDMHGRWLICICEERQLLTAASS